MQIGQRWTRREVLAAGAVAGAGLALPGMLAAAAAASEPAADACILLWLCGGPSQLETFDPKPEAPLAVRGPFGALRTSTDGLLLSEHLPLLAQEARRFCVLRSLTSADGGHETATHALLTGRPFAPGVTHPSLGALVARGAPPGETPPYFLLGKLPFGYGGGGSLGAGCNPFQLPGFHGEDLLAPEQVPCARAALPVAAAEPVSPPGAVRRALRLNEEPAALREAYGESAFGRRCLLARRLTEAGARFVHVTFPGWDTHREQSPALRDRLLPQLDRGLSALLRDLAARGRLARTLVVCVGEFGRAPRLNRAGGRDHWPRAFSALLAGGPVRGGTVVGETDAHGAEVTERLVTSAEFAATLQRALGLPAEGEVVVG